MRDLWLPRFVVFYCYLKWLNDFGELYVIVCNYFDNWVFFCIDIFYYLFNQIFSYHDQLLYNILIYLIYLLRSRGHSSSYIQIVNNKCVRNCKGYNIYVFQRGDIIVRNGNWKL